MENLIIRRLENKRKYMNDIRRALDGKTYNELSEELFVITQLYSTLYLIRVGMYESDSTEDISRALYLVENGMYTSIKKIGEMMGEDYLEMR
ncbi:MAG: hypothetical protein HFG29_10420 [Eubacterium sp.]|nr:hypothetical protein [Eubacterium sp.]